MKDAETVAKLSAMERKLTDAEKDKLKDLKKKYQRKTLLTVMEKKKVNQFTMQL